jgi:hypothetical protein
MSKIRYLREFGPRLLSKGYPIVPIKKGYKFPKGLSGWEHTQATQQDLDRWLSTGFWDGGVGVLTRDFPAVDIDCLDAEVVDALVAFIHKEIGVAPIRIGEAPKCLLPFRAERPFSKLLSKRYECLLGDAHRVEILGDGQQFVAYAKHPGTRLPYSWPKTELVDIHPEDLPILTVEQAQRIIDEFERLADASEFWQCVSVGSTAQAVAHDDLCEDARILNNYKDKLNVSEARLRQAIDAIEPDCGYELWSKVGMGLHHQFDGSEEGFELWDEWSARGEKYNPKEMRAKWNSFGVDLKRHEPVTAATIMGMARDIERENNEDHLSNFLENYIYVKKGDQVMDLSEEPHHGLCKLIEFKNDTANVLMDVPAPTPKDPERTVKKPVSLLWMTHKHRRSAVGTEYTPNAGRLVRKPSGRLWVNTFHMPEFTVSNRTDQLGVFNEHIHYLFPIEAEREWFISWMAFCLQRPEIRCKVVPLHIAIPHGTGRGWVVELMSKLLGFWNISKTKMRTLAGEGPAGQYQDYLNESLLCSIEEVRENKKRFEISDAIRDFLIDSPLEVNCKYGGKRTQFVYTNFFFMSNHPDALVLPIKDRRINVFSGPDFVQSRDYYMRLYQWLEGEGVHQLHSFLMRRDLSDFDWGYSMMTPARQAMLENNRSVTETLFWELMESPTYPAMTFQQIVTDLRGRSESELNDLNIDETQLLKLLQHHASKYKQVSVEGKKLRPWVLVKESALKIDDVKNAIIKCGV